MSEKKVVIQEQEQVEHQEVIPPELEALLHTDPPTGLLASQVSERQMQFGFNEIPEERCSRVLMFLSYFIGSIAYLLGSLLHTVRCRRRLDRLWRDPRRATA